MRFRDYHDVANFVNKTLEGEKLTQAEIDAALDALYREYEILEARRKRSKEFFENFEMYMAAKYAP